MRLVNIYNYRREVYTFWREDSGALKITKYTGFFPYYYEPDVNGQYKSYKGDKLKRVVVSEPAEVARRRSSEAMEADILYTKRFAIDAIDVIEKCPIKVAFIDIEVKAKELPDVKLANCPVSCISVYNSFAKVIKTFFLPNYNSEYEMIDAFCSYMKTEKFDLWLSWNVKFDYNYLANRFPDFIEKISPIGKSRYGDGDVFYPAGISIIDYLMWFKKITLNREKMYTLDHISQKYLKMPPKAKIDFTVIDENLKQHNIDDVKALVGLEAQKKLVAYFDEVRRMSKVEWEDIEFNSRIIDMLLLEEAKKQKVVLPMKPMAAEEVEFEGAFREVYDTGVFEHVGKYDLSSAYPYAIINFCLDPANICSLEEGQNLKYVETDTMNNSSIFIEETYFRQNESALLPTVTKRLIELKTSIKKELESTKVDSPGYADIKKKYDAIKSMVNSAYGVMGNRFFRLYDSRVASATTFIVRSLLHYVKAKLDEKGYKVIYVDTDSVFIQSNENLTEMLNKIVQEWGKITFKKDKVDIEFDYEGYFESIIIFAKCRYHAWLRKKSGELEEETKGIEAKRKDSTEYMKTFQKALLEKIHKKETKDSIFAWIKQQINEFKNQKLTDISLPGKLAHSVDTYKVIPIFVRALQNTPDFDKKVGDSFYYVFMQGKDASKKELVMAFDEEKSDHIDTEKVDWNKMLERNIVMKLETLFEAMKWNVGDVYTPPPTSKICDTCGTEKSLCRYPETGNTCKVCITKREKDLAKAAKKAEKEAAKQAEKAQKKAKKDKEEPTNG